MGLIQVACTKVVDHMGAQMFLSMEVIKIMVLNMEAVTYHNMDQVKTRMGIVVVLDKVQLRKHTHHMVKVMLQLLVWAAHQFLNILRNLQVKNRFGGLKHNKNFLHLTMVVLILLMLLRLQCQVNPLNTNNLHHTLQQH